MIVDKFGQFIFTENDLCNTYLTNPEIQLKKVLVSDHIDFNSILDLENRPDLIQYVPNNMMTINKFDTSCQDQWFMPDEYKTFDIAKFILDQCEGEAELQRAGKELLLYQERNMFVLLRYLKYLVDVMRANNIVWGVGRGSCVSSFVLYIIGIHKVNSLYYDLDIKEFLK